MRILLRAAQPCTSSLLTSVHADGRPPGTFPVASCVVDAFNADGIGSCPVTYRAPFVSGVERIVAKAPTFTDAKPEAKVKIEVPDLVELPPDPSRYVLVGAPNNHALTNDPCRKAAPTSLHFQNHFALPTMRDAVIAIADTMLRETGILIRVNDMSLPTGGLFDIKNDWKPKHDTHRVGREADIGFTGIMNGVCTAFDEDRLFTVIRDIARRAPLIENTASGTHFHAHLP